MPEWCPQLLPSQGFYLWGGRRNQVAPGWRVFSTPCQAVGLDFFGSMVAACRTGQLSQRDTRRFVTSFLEAKAKTKSMFSRPKRGTGQCGHCGLGTLLWTPNTWVGAPNTWWHLPLYLLS